jgi:hypothetical protein
MLSPDDRVRGFLPAVKHGGADVCQLVPRERLAMGVIAHAPVS